MKILPILTAIALGASAGSVVAEPDRPIYGQYYGQTHRGEGWVTLTAPLANFSNREFIKVGRDAGRFERIRLDVQAGRLFVRQILVEFADGSTQKLVLGRRLHAGEHIVLDVPGRGRAIHRLVVYTDPARGRRGRGEYVVSAAPSRSQYGYERRFQRDYWRR